MKNLHIRYSYIVWKPKVMKKELMDECFNTYRNIDPDTTLNRSYLSMYIEWWLHNIGYYLTKPFTIIDKINKLNLRFRDVDIEEWKSK